MLYRPHLRSLSSQLVHQPGNGRARRLGRPAHTRGYEVRATSIGQRYVAEAPHQKRKATSNSRHGQLRGERSGCRDLRAASHAYTYDTISSIWVPTVRPEFQAIVSYSTANVPSPSRVNACAARGLALLPPVSDTFLANRGADLSTCMELVRTEEQRVCAIYSHRGAVSVLADSARSIGIAGQTDQRGGRGTPRPSDQKSTMIH